MEEKTAVEILEQRRRADARRVKEWQQRQKKLGKRHFSGLLSAEAYDAMQHIREWTGLSAMEIIEPLILKEFETQKMARKKSKKK